MSAGGRRFREDDTLDNEQNNQEFNNQDNNQEQNDRKEYVAVQEPRDVRQRSEIRSKKRKRGKFLRGFIFFLCLLLPIFFVSMFAFKFVFEEEEYGILTGELVDVNIPDGATTQIIGDILLENELIPNVLQFRIRSRIGGFDGTYKRGDYKIDTGLSSNEIMQLLQTGVVLEDIRITIPEGYSVSQMAKKVEEIGFATAEEFIDEVQNGVFNYDFINDIPDDRDFRLEGYLFPNTYMVTEKNDVHDLINLMLAEFNRVYTEEMMPFLETYPFEYTLDELVVMASIIEKEIVVAEEKPIAAGVIYNRLDAGMPLQMDATVLYAMGIVKEDVTYADLEIDSPYNTYKINGLPIGPISNPGELSLVATVNPENHNYIYYVLEARGQSNHVYTETYNEFLAAKNKYKNS